MTWRPLEGVRVLDLTAMLPGPFASQTLVDLGASVVKVERPGGDAMRTLQPHMFDAVNRGKHSVVLDLRDPDQRETLLTLASKADVFLEGFRPGVLDRLGAGFNAVSARNPQTVYVSLSGWGQDGPMAAEPGHNGTFLARSGAVHLTEEPGRAASESFPIPVADLSASLYAVIAVLSALRSPRAEPIHFDVPLFGGALAFMVPRLAEYLESGASSGAEITLRAANGAFPTEDGSVVIAAVEDRFWRTLCDVMGLADLGARDDLRRYSDRLALTAEVNARISDATREWDRDALVNHLTSAGVPVAPVLAPEEVARQEQAVHLGYLQSDEVHAFLPITGPELPGTASKVALDSAGDYVRQAQWPLP